MRGSKTPLEARSINSFSMYSIIQIYKCTINTAWVQINKSEVRNEWQEDKKGGWSGSFGYGDRSHPNTQINSQQQARITSTVTTTHQWSAVEPPVCAINVESAMHDRPKSVETFSPLWRHNHCVQESSQGAGSPVCGCRSRWDVWCALLVGTCPRRCPLPVTKKREKRNKHIWILKIRNISMQSYASRVLQKWLHCGYNVSQW